MAKIVVIGSMNTDLVVQTPRMPQEGETIQGLTFNRNFGGKGANQAVAARSLGADTVMVGRVGNDIFGHDQIRSLQERGIDVDFVTLDEHAPTGTASIILDEQGNNRIIIVPGANGQCTREDIDRARDGIASADMVVLQLGIPLEIVEYAIDIAESCGTKAILNPAPAARLPEDIYKKITVFTPNESEATLLSGIEVTIDTVREAAQSFRDKGVENVVITLGSNGVYGLSQDGEFKYPVFPVKPVDTVAAGDAFTGALAVGLAEGKTLAEASLFANGVAALAVTKPGAQAAMPSRGEVEAFLANQKELNS